MRLASEISIQRVAVRDDQVSFSDVCVRGAPCGQQVEGAVLEAAVECNGRFLLFLTADVPFEDSLSIHLLDGSGHLLDSARVGWMYSTGSFSALALHEPNRVGFRFIGDTDWSVTLFGEARWRSPLLTEPRGVSRPLRLRYWFRIQGRPLPQSR